jgi:hypothetical protein
MAAAFLTSPPPDLIDGQLPGALPGRRDLAPFGSRLTFAGVAPIDGLAIDALVIGVLLTHTDLGLYAIGFAFESIPVLTLIGMASVAAPRLAAMADPVGRSKGCRVPMDARRSRVGGRGVRAGGAGTAACASGGVRTCRRSSAYRGADSGPRRFVPRFARRGRTAGPWPPRPVHLGGTDRLRSAAGGGADLDHGIRHQRRGQCPVDCRACECHGAVRASAAARPVRGRHAA